MKNIIIIGAGGHAKVIADIILKSNDNVVGFLDDNINLQNQEIFNGIKVIGLLNDINQYHDCYFIIGIGNNTTRKTIAEKYNLKWYTAIHPNAIIANDVSIGDGTVIMPSAIINTSSKIGKHVIINTKASIDHDNIIEDYVHVSPGATLAGTVHIKENTWIGAGVTIINNITITSNVIIGAGAVVINDINESGTYVGVPVRKV